MAQSVNPADAGISVGQVFQGKYRVEAILGFGGMGVVAECTHLALNERVAVKMLRQDVLQDKDAVQRFIREAQAAVKLKSEYVARVSDVGTFENGVPYMVMEYLEGHDLGELLKQRGVLPVQWAVELMLQTAEALAEAHSLGIVHRDVKPTNLFVTWRPDGTALIKVLDFGISKSPMGTDMHLTQTQSLLGTPAYMSPEQMRSARLVDTRTDIWSLGTVFYEILEGRKPFEAESFSEMCVKVAVDPPGVMQNAPPGLQQVILKCLAKTPEQRYVSMADFARDLVPYAADPHGGQMLVERMARMLKRANMDWEGTSTGVGRQAIPGSINDVGSGPVRASGGAQNPLWGLGSDPAGAAWQVKSDPAMRAWHGNTPIPRGDASQPFARPFSHDPSQPFARPLGEDASGGFARPTVPQSAVKKSRTPLILAVLGLLTAGAVAFGVMKATDQKSLQPSGQQGTAPVSDSVDPKAATTDTAHTDNAGSAAAGAAAGSAGSAAGSAAIDTATSGSGAGSNLTAPQPTLDGTGDKPVTIDKTTPQTKSGKSKTGAGKTGAGKTGAGKTGTTTVKTQPDKTIDKTDKKLEPAETTTTTTKPADGKPCDPFGAMHGCSKK